jgi:AraC family ethanolamine operon transcriptional activator
MNWNRLLETDDIDAHAAAQPEWELRYEQLSGGHFRGTLHQAQLPGLRLVHESASRAMRQRGRLGRDCYGFAVFLDLPGVAICNGQRLDAGSIMVGRADDLDLCSPAGLSMMGAVVDGDLLNRLWQGMHGTSLASWLDSQVVLSAHPRAVQALRELHLDALAGLSSCSANDAAALLEIRDAVLLGWLEALPAQPDRLELRTAAARRRLVDRACERMLSHGGEPLSLLEVCSRIGASPRKLNYCFHEVLGMSPARYLRAVRLNGARRELKSALAAEVCVQDVAARWGFWHAGQFSLDYKRQFGELPSATLRESRAR